MPQLKRAKVVARRRSNFICFLVFAFSLAVFSLCFPGEQLMERLLRVECFLREVDLDRKMPGKPGIFRSWEF